MAELRRPKPAYMGRNGFAVSTSTPVSNIGASSRLQVEEAKKRRLAEWVLKVKGSHFPTLEEMKRSNAEPETTATIKRRIDELKTQHTKDMECLYAYYAHIYRQEQEDLRFSKDDSLFLERDDSAGLAELAEFEARLEELYRNSRLPINYQLEWDDAASRIRYAHLQALLPLQKKLAQLSSRFPESLEAYRAMYNNQDMQLKVARFLMGGNMRDSMLSDFGWAWRQVKPLTDVFDRDADFRAEVQRYVKDSEVRDPRTRRQSSTTENPWAS